MKQKVQFVKFKRNGIKQMDEISAQVDPCSVSQHS